MTTLRHSTGYETNHGHVSASSISELRDKLKTLVMPFNFELKCTSNSSINFYVAKVKLKKHTAKIWFYENVDYDVARYLRNLANGSERFEFKSFKPDGELFAEVHFTADIPRFREFICDASKPGPLYKLTLNNIQIDYSSNMFSAF